MLVKRVTTRLVAIEVDTADGCRRKLSVLGLRRGLSFAISAPRGKVIYALVNHSEEVGGFCENHDLLREMI
jgi:hypothetical protein